MFFIYILQNALFAFLFNFLCFCLSEIKKMYAKLIPNNSYFAFFMSLYFVIMNT